MPAVWNEGKRESDTFHKSSAMESGNGGASSKGVLVPVSDTSDVFHNCILAPLRGAYLYEESKESFRYNSAVLIKNPTLEEKYKAFRAKRRAAGYSEEDLKETYGFLLFGDANEAHALGQTGVLTGNGTRATLGDPCKGVYISMHSDCLDLNHWYNGKSGYIAIIRLTKGRVQKVLENYTQNFTAPTVGFDCHVSEQLLSVSARTSSFLAFERTQYYVYELVEDGSNETAQSPSAACPFAIVSFSYMDTKSTLVAPQKTSEEKKVVHYLPWKGRLEIGTQFYNVGLRSKAGALIPAKLPPVVKVDKAIPILNLIQLLPRAVFETCFSGEVFLDGLYCSLCELVPSKAEEKALSLLLQEIKEKDVALPVLLNDGGFLILLHSSHFLTYDDTASNTTEVLQGMFLFPGSRVIQRGTKSDQRKATTSSEILQVLPVLSYAEGEVEKTSLDPSEELCEVLAQHMQSCAALINPGVALSPSREVCIFPDQYDVPDATNTSEWTNRAWHSFRSYLSKPDSFQLPVTKASEILAAGQEEQREDFEDNVCICLSSPEEALANLVEMESEAKLIDQKSPVKAETSLESCITSAEAQVDLPALPQNVIPDDLQAGDLTKDKEKSDLTLLIKRDDTRAGFPQTPSTSDDLSAELIVSITSAEQTVTDESLSVIGTMSAMKQKDFQCSGFSAAKQQAAEMNSLHDENAKIQNKDCPEIRNFTKAKQRMLRKGHSKVLKKSSKAGVEAISSQTPKIPGKDDQTKESLGRSKLSNPSNPHWRKLRRQKCKFGNLSSKNKEERSATAGLAVAKERKWKQNLEGTILMELDVYALRKKTERWDLKPVISECGRILVPHGSVDVVDQITFLKDELQCAKHEQPQDDLMVDAPLNACDKVLMLPQPSIAPEREVGEKQATTSTDGANHLQSLVAVHTDAEHSFLGHSDNGSLPLTPKSSEKNDGIDTPPSEAEKHRDARSPGISTTKGEILLSKLKSVLLRGKKKHNFHALEGTPTAQDAEPCLKKGKIDSDSEALKSDNAISSVKDASVSVKEVSKMLSVDPLFAYALGLTPKEKPVMLEESEGRDSQLRPDSQEETILDKQPQIIHRPLSIFPRRSRIKTLKKHQGISAEYIKQKWWLHFQTPACFATEKLKYKEFTRDNSVRETLKEKMNSACSSTDALNLLADLALSTGASNDQVPPQPEPAHEKPETSLKTCGLTKDVTNAEQESVLHALLRQPAARPTQPPESPSPSHLVGGSELVGLISNEHAYSLPPSSPLLLGLPGIPFQVSPISGSTGLLHQQVYGRGVQSLQPSVCQEDGDEPDHRTPECLTKYVRRRKFRHSRTFVTMDGSVQVTRQWNRSYDFKRDSKFACDPEGRAIIRALHGPWNFSIPDTAEEAQLIVHMWIGLFYSRSTPRFYHVDSNFALPNSEESDFMDTCSGMVPAPAQSELKANSFGAFPSMTDTEDPSVSKALDLSKKDNSVLDQGSAILDLSLGNSSAEKATSDSQVNRKETSVPGEWKEAGETPNSHKSSVTLQEASTFQHYEMMAHSTEIIKDANDVRSKKTLSPLQKPGCLQHPDLPSFKGAGPFIPAAGEMESIWTENVQTPSGIGHTFHGYNKEKTLMKVGNENSETTVISMIQKHDSFKSMTKKEVESNKESDEVVRTDVHNEIKSKDRENWGVKENTCQEVNIEPPPNVIHTGSDSTNKELGIICDETCFENEKQLSREEPKTISPGQTENINGDMDCCPDEDKVGRENGLDGCISAVEADSDLSDQPLSMTCDSPVSVIGKDACQDLQLRKFCKFGSALTDEKAPCVPSQMEPVCNEPVVEENPENSVCLADKAPYQKTALLISDGSTCSLNESCVVGPNPQAMDSLEKESQNTVFAIFTLGLSSDGQEDQKSQSVVVEEKDDKTSEEPFHHQSHSPQCEVIQRCEAEEAFTEETDLKLTKTNEGMEKIQSGVEPPLMATDISGGDIAQPHISHPQGKVEELVQIKKGKTFVNEMAYPDLPMEVQGTFKMNSKEKQPSAEKISFLDVSETNQPVVFGRESDDRCPTPTLDDNAHECIPCSSSSSETCKDMTQRCLNRTPTFIKDEMPLVQKLCDKSTFSSDPNNHYGLHPDLDLRTPRVLQSIDKYLFKPNYSDESSQTQTIDMKICLDQAPNLSSKNIFTHLVQDPTLADSKDKKISYSEPVIVSTSTSQEPHKESPDHFLIAPLKKRLKEVPGMGLELNKTHASSPLPQHYFERTETFQETSTGQDCCHPCTSVPSECGQKLIQISTKKDIKQHHETKTAVDVYTMPTYLERMTEGFKGHSGLKYDKQESSEVSSNGSWLSDATDRKSNLHKTKFALLDPTYQYQGRPSSLSMQSFESSKSDGHHSFLTYSLENIEMDQEGCSEASNSFADYKDNSLIDDSLNMGPQGSLICTILNTSQKRSFSFLEEVSQRCLQKDPTQALMEQECLIFSEQMKQLLKKSSRAPIHQQDTDDSLRLSCSSPLTVHFSSLEEQEDSLDLLDAPSLVGQRIKVDLSDRNDVVDSTEEEKNLHPQILSPGTGNPKEHAGGSGATAECARLYEAMMDDICAVRKFPSGLTPFRMDRVYKRSKQSNYFDFCNQMKREMDESFQSNLSSVVKKSCKTKYRFYILVTSDDPLLDKTKAQLEAEGHTAVQPSEFFLGAGSSSSLLIILRNEDIAEHICEVPHLLKLKKSPRVQFAGIDEPVDIVNLTHQELFTRGGLLMFDRAALASLSLRNMKKCFKILQELSRTGKWKWMLHYRDSRWLKENARLSAEAKEKQHFLNYCQDTEILEVLPYHDCDVTSRDQPDYLACLVHLQVQNISARYTVFITGTTTDSAFGRNGILTMTANAFLTSSGSEMFTV